jgi:imidazolonepropionase-like amidohydrolase
MSGIAWLVLAVAVPAEDLQIAHVTIVSPERTSEMHDALVRVHDGRIEEISKANSAAARSSANAIDGSGLFLLLEGPGLFDRNSLHSTRFAPAGVE